MYVCVQNGSIHDSCIYACKFQKKEPNFEVFVSLVKLKKNWSTKYLKKEQITGSVQEIIHSI